MSDDPLDRVKGFFSEGDPPPPSRPRRGRYEIVREIGRGGMAVVYEAFDPDLRRAVALKVLEGGDRERLRREAAAAARLKHPNIVTIHEVGPDFIAMERVEGKTLAEALPALSLRERVAALERVARAVAHAHAQGVVHRDLKPGNILLEPGGRPVITDFGLARIAGDEDLTRTGSVVGTPHYMAPEQVRGDVRSTGPATDVWALGVILHEMVSGRRPFEGRTALAVYDAIVREEPGPLPGDLGAVAARALEKDPARRTAGADAFAEDLRRFLEGEPVSARPAGPLERAWRRARRHPVGSALAAGLLVAFVAAAIFGAAGRTERARGVEGLRRQARVALEAALELRRAGSNAGMRKFLPPLEEACREASARDPGLAEVDYLLGRMHRALLEDDRALEYQERALAKDEGYVPALYERAVLLSMRRGRGIKSALDALQGEDAGPVPGERALRERISRDARAFLEAGWGSVESLVARGLLAACEDRTAEARELLDQALRRDPLLEEAREALAAVVRAEIAPGVEGRERGWKRAEEVYTQGIARDLGYLPHFMGRGQLRWSRGSARRHRGLDPLPDYRAAEEDFARAAALDSRSADAWTWRGEARTYQAIYAIEKGEDPRPLCTRAEEDFDRAIREDATHARAWLWRGNVRFYRGTWRAERGQDPLPDFDASERDLAEAVGRNPSPETELRWRGRERAQRAAALGRVGQDPLAVFAAGEEDFARSAAIRPPDAWHHLWKSTIASERGLHRRSRGGDPRADLALAERDLEEALRLNRHFAEAWKHRGFVRWHRAEFLEKSGDRTGAKDAYAAAAADFSEALSINPTLGVQVGDRVERARRKASELGS